MLFPKIIRPVVLMVQAQKLIKYETIVIAPMTCIQFLTDELKAAMHGNFKLKRMVIKMSFLLTTDLFLFIRYVLKFIKKLCTSNFINMLLIIILCAMVNLQLFFANNTQSLKPLISGIWRSTRETILVLYL